MKSLPNVTLISYDNTSDPRRTLRALNHCASMIQFAAVILVARNVSQHANGTCVFRVNESGYPAAMQWEVSDVGTYVETDFALCIHHDGYILNPDKWSDSWFDYDFIGAPWPVQICADHPTRRVGNTGFCLKSRAFMHYCAQLGHLFDNHTPGDVFCCRTIADQLESFGMKY